VLSAALAVVPAVQAASVEIVSSAASEGVSAELVYQAAAGERNAVTLTAAEGAANPSGCCVWTVHDAGALIVAGALCVSVAPDTARCAPQALEHAVDEAVPDVRARLGDLDDRLRVDDRTDGAVESVHADGGDGDDVISSAAGFLDEISGGAGDDRLFGGGGLDDEIYGRSGNDRLFGGAQEDLLNGGGGHDELHGRGGDDDLDDGDRDGASGEAAPGPDLLDGGRGSDRVSYDARRAPVSVNLARGSGSGSGEHGEGDTLASMKESLAGGATIGSPAATATTRCGAGRARTG
jgi:RTX calcium-binding nonapeptide repeat (4 copies)